MTRYCLHSHILNYTPSSLEKWYSREMLVTVEGIQKVGDEVIIKAMVVEEMVMLVVVMRHQEGKWLVKMIELNFMLFRARMRQRCLT